MYYCHDCGLTALSIIRLHRVQPEWPAASLCWSHGNACTCTQVWFYYREIFSDTNISTCMYSLFPEWFSGDLHCAACVWMCVLSWWWWKSVLRSCNPEIKCLSDEHVRCCHNTGCEMTWCCGGLPSTTYFSLPALLYMCCFCISVKKLSHLDLSSLVMFH